MNNYPNTFSNKLRVFFVCILIIASPFILLVIMASAGSNTVQAQSLDQSSSPNLITSGVSVATDRLSQTMDSTSMSARSTITNFASATSNSMQVVAHGARIGMAFPAHVAQDSLSFTSTAIVKSGKFVSRLPVDGWGLVAHNISLSSIIRPADHVKVPIIDPASPELQAALKALPPAKNTAPSTPTSNAGPAWPIHGEITTEFGVAHWPYQPTHTGIDISDGRAPGITPVKPFRPGLVVQVIRSKSGLGNHIVIDHGNGVTSVYGHLAAINVEVGQTVSLATTLGLEGSTGASTGTHLHFEIRVNGQAANPHQFISGHP